MIIDLHCHYTFTRRPQATSERFSFEPLHDGGQSTGDAVCPTSFDSCVAPRALHRLSWRLARRYLHLPPPGDALDHHLERVYLEHLTVDGPIERFVLLAFDAVHDDDGRCTPLPDPGNKLGSDIYTSNSLIRDMCQRYPDRFLFGASVHPYRTNAVACVREVFAAGACLLKWLPLHHNIDVSDPRAVAVLRLCHELGLPILVHCGDEFSLRAQRRAYRSVRPLLDVLQRLHRDGCMPCTIVAHAATPATPLGDHDSHRALLAALTGHFADAPLYADVSALASWAKARFLKRLARRQDLHAKLLFGSDFPIPPAVWRFRRQLGSDHARVARVQSWPQRAALACQFLGLNDVVFHRAAELLPNIGFFNSRSPEPSA